MGNTPDDSRLTVAEALLKSLDAGGLPAAVGTDEDVWLVLLRDVARHVGMQMSLDGELTYTPESKGRLKLYVSELRKHAIVPVEQSTMLHRDKRNVFVVHGRNTKARDAVFTFLRALDLNPIEWEKARSLTRKPNPYVGEILDAAFGHAEVVVVVLTGDDQARVREAFIDAQDESSESQWQYQPRPNVIFECGIALGRDARRTVVVQIGPAKRFTDLDGVHILRLADTSESRKEFAERLVTAGAPADTSGTDFLSAGNLKGALDLASQAISAPTTSSPEQLQATVPAAIPDASARIRIQGWLNKLHWNRSGEAIALEEIERTCKVGPGQPYRLLPQLVPGGEGAWNIQALSEHDVILKYVSRRPPPRTSRLVGL
jgi:predicted nucleotide-binding protein